MNLNNKGSLAISVIILTKNEEKNIEACLHSVRWSNDIIIIDDNSTDNTTEIAKRTRFRVIRHLLDNNFANQRNFGLQQAKNEWVLFVDADERISDSLREEIINAVGNAKNQLNGFLIPRKDVLWRRKLHYGETGKIKLLRLAKKSTGKWEGKVHEVWNINGLVGELKNPILHHPHQIIKEYLSEINFYTSLRAQELNEKNIRVYWWEVILYPKGKFLVNYFLKKGFLDGIPGLILSLMMSFHSFLVRAKLWLSYQKTK